MINLNDENILGNSIQVFNNGVAGKVNAKVESVEKFENKPMPTHPDFRIHFVDKSGNKINKGVYYPTSTGDAIKDKENLMNTIRPIISIIKAISPEGFVFPSTEGKSANGIVDMLIGILKENLSSGTPVNVFTTYGRKTNPSKYLNIRNFDFIEKGDTPESESRLKPTGNDMMERLVEDTPNSEASANNVASW